MLTKQQQQDRMKTIIILIANGFSDKEISRIIGYSHKTIRNILVDERELYKSKNRTELVVSALIQGEITLKEIQQWKKKTSQHI